MGRQKRRRPVRSRKRKTSQKGRGIAGSILTDRLTAIPKGAKMLYNIAKGRPTSERIKKQQDKYARKYAKYKSDRGTLSKLDWARKTKAVIRPDPCCIQ